METKVNLNEKQINEFDNSKGAIMINCTYQYGNNSTEQNLKEATARMINRVEDLRHLGENFNDSPQAIAELNREINEAQADFHSGFLKAQSALRRNQKQ